MDKNQPVDKTPASEIQRRKFYSQIKMKNQENDFFLINKKLRYQNSQISLFKLKLEKNDQGLMKPSSTFRNNNSTHSLLSMKDYHKPTLSRQKQEEVQSRSRNKNFNHKQQYDPKPPKLTSFKTMSDNASNDISNRVFHQTKHRNVNGAQNNEYNNKGILMNMNCQNGTITKHGQNLTTLASEHEPTPKIERNLVMANEGKKPRKVSKLRPDPDDLDLECNEDLSLHLKKTSKSETGIKDKYVQKPINLEPNLSSKSKTQTLKFANKNKQKLVIAIDHKQVIKKFQQEALGIQAESDYENLIYIDALQQGYSVNPDYILKKQKNFTWIMRAVLVEWIMQVCYEFSLKRQTFYIAVNIADRFFQQEPNLLKSDFQLVGAASMFIASKLQEFQPKSSQYFAKTTNNEYTAKQIKNMQRRICNALRYQLNPPTLYRWANLLMSQWDNFLKQNSYAEKHPLFALKDPIYFKQVQEDAYMHFRELMQLIDCSILQIQTYQYNPKLLVCSFMYLMIGRNMEIFTSNQIQTFQSRSQYLIKDNLLNDLFENFLEFTFSIQLRQLLPIVQYCSTFFNLPVSYDEPMIQNSEQAQENMQLQEYCSFQTFDKNMLIVVKKRFRGRQINRY